MMKKPSALFSDDEKVVIAEAIGEAERLTSGEIIPVVAAASGRYDRAEDIFGVLFSLVVLAIYWSLFTLPASSGWSADGVANPSLWPVVVILIVSFVVGAILATVFPVLRLPFISKKEMQEEVERCALETFQRLRVRATENATGVLIYVSLYERMVRVIGDDAINAKLSQEDWQKVCDLVVHGMKLNRHEAAMITAIEHCGELLAKHFPVGEEGKNELDNALILIDD